MRNRLISPENLLIVEQSPHYSKDLLKEENRQGEEFLEMIQEDNGMEIYECLLPEQIRIFENVTRHGYPVKYFINTITDKQLQVFEQRINKSYQLNGSFPFEGQSSRYYDEGEQHSYFADDFDSSDSIDYKRELKNGILRVENVEIFKHLNFSVFGDEAGNGDKFKKYFDDKILEAYGTKGFDANNQDKVNAKDQLIGDLLHFVDNLTMQQAKQFCRYNPVLVSESAMNSFINKLNFSNEESKEFEFSTHKDGEIFFENQTEQRRPSSYKDLNDPIKNLGDPIPRNASKNQLDTDRSTKRRTNPRKFLGQMDSKAMSSIEKFTQHSQDDHEDKQTLFEMEENLSNIMKQED